ncbi:MAG: hypothetical protein ABII64_00895 [Elusimicrobiota bacterium]
MIKRRRYNYYVVPMVLTMLFALIVYNAVNAKENYSSKNEQSKYQSNVIKETDVIVKRIDINTINEICAEIDGYVKSNEKKRLYFGDVSDATSEKESRWVKFVSAEERKVKSTGDNLCEIADVWIRNNDIVFLIVFYTSPSGDWSKSACYYFYKNGNTAKITSELRTSYGNVIVKDELLFSLNGKLVRSDNEILDIDTKKTVSKEKMKEGYIDPEIKNIMKISILPFIGLIR